MKSIGIRIVTIAAGIILSPLACRQERNSATDVQEATAVQEVETPLPDPEMVKRELAELKRKMERHQQAIGDMEAAAEMERSKIVHNPEYDRSFLNQVLFQQEEERSGIEQAQKRIDELTRQGGKAE